MSTKIFAVIICDVMNKLFSSDFKILIVLAAISFSILLPGCGEKLYSDPQMTAESSNASDASAEAAETSSGVSAVQATDTPVEYEAVTARIESFTSELNAYMRENITSASSTETQGTTYAGNPATCTYTLSADGVYKILSTLQEYEDKTVTTEYFAFGDAMFVARSTYYPDTGSFDPSVKYYITGGTVYYVNYDAEQLTEVASADSSADQTSLDMYFSFEEIEAIYG